MLMGVSLLGIIAFQLYWIHQAYLVKEEQFDRSVQEALNQVAAKLETHEAVDVIRGQMQQQQQSPPSPARPIAGRPSAPATSRRTQVPPPGVPGLKPVKKARLALTADT